MTVDTMLTVFDNFNVWTY